MARSKNSPSLPVVTDVVPRITGKAGVYAGFVYFGEDRLTFHNVEGIQKEAGGRPIKQEYVTAAEEAVKKAVADGEFVLAAPGSKD
jgi:hypothetical protein